MVVHGVSRRAVTTLGATEGRTTVRTPGEILRHDPITAPGLDLFIALYAHPDNLETSPYGSTIWKNAGRSERHDATVASDPVEPVVSGFGGIGWAFEGAAATALTMDILSGADQTWELWFRPQPGASGRGVILESGGNGNGTLIYYDADRNTVGMIVDGGSNTNPDYLMQAELEGVSWDEFNQFIAVFDVNNPGQPDVLTIYLNNDPASVFSTANSATVTNASGLIEITCGTDGTGIGTVSGTTASDYAYNDFPGMTAHALVYDYKLPPAQMVTAYNAIRKPLTSVQGGATGLGATVSLNAGIVTYDATALSTNIPYAATAADSFTCQFTDSDGSAVDASAPVEVTGTGLSLALDDTIVISADTVSTNFNPMLNDSGLTGAAVITGNVVVADYQDDYQGGVNADDPADFRDGSGYGWQYLWNAPTGWVSEAQFDGSSGSITNSDNYIHLVWNPGLNYWFVNSGGGGTSGSPGIWLRCGQGEICPGYSAFDDPTNTLSRYAIVAYTVGEAGYYSIADSYLNRERQDTNDGLDLLIMVNGTVISHEYIPPLTVVGFDTDLGLLYAGDTIYVACGPALERDGDFSYTDFSIVKRAAVDAQVADISGVVTNNGTSLTYYTDGQFISLGEGQSAFETFTYTVRDNGGELSTATVTIEVQGVNDAPVANNDTPAVDEDSVLNDNVLDNDSDPDHGDVQNLAVSEVQGAPGNVGVQTTSDRGALVTLYSGGWFTYDHTNMFNSLALGESTTDTFRYIIEDALGASSGEATVTVTITGNDDGVVARDNAYSLDDDETVSGNVITDNTGEGVDINIDTNDILVISSVDASGVLGDLTLGELQTVCIRGKVTPTGSPQTVTYSSGSSGFKNPVVFATPGGISDPEPGSIVIINITDSTFDIYFKEQMEIGGKPSDNDGNLHTNTTEISWMVFDCGEYMLADGTRFEVGKTEISAMHAKNAGTLDWDEVVFSTPFASQPVVINQIQEWNDPDGELFGTRMSGSPYISGGVTTSRFEIALEEYEGASGSTPYSNTVGWIACENTSGTWDGNTFETGVKTGVKAYATTIPTSTFNFGPTFAEPPYLLGCLATVNGGDPAVLRSYVITTDTFQMFQREDTCNDAEQTHSDENLTFLAVDGSGPLTAYNISGGAGSFTYDPAGKVFPTSTQPVVETFTYTLRDIHGNTSTATVNITVYSREKGTLMIIR